MQEETEIMMQSVTYFLVFIGAFFSGYLLRWFFAGKKIKEAEHKAKELMESWNRRRHFQNQPRSKLWIWFWSQELHLIKTITV